MFKRPSDLIISFNPPQNLLRWLLLLFPIPQRRNLDVKRESLVLSRGRSCDLNQRTLTSKPLCFCHDPVVVMVTSIILCVPLHLCVPVAQRRALRLREVVWLVQACAGGAGLQSQLLGVPSLCSFFHACLNRVPSALLPADTEQRWERAQGSGEGCGKGGSYR